MLSISGPLNIKLVTQYYPSGNLTMYLGNKFSTDDIQTGLLHKLSLEITQALVYLETLAVSYYLFESLKILNPVSYCL